MKFKPTPKSKDKRHIGVEFEPEKYEKISQAAKKSDVSIKEFCRQAIAYAMGWK